MCAVGICLVRSFLIEADTKFDTQECIKSESFESSPGLSDECRRAQSSCWLSDQLNWAL